MASHCIKNIQTAGLPDKTKMMMETTSNKNIIAQFYKQVIGQRDDSLISKLVREDYIQHSPSAKDGRAGLIEMVSFLKTLPISTETQSPVKMLIADGDFVTGLMDIRFMGKRMLVIDLFRLQDGMLAEHWDAVQEVDADIIIDSIAVNENATDSDASKELIRNKSGSALKRVIGEGEVVVTQSALIVNDKLIASYDVYCIANGAIIKHLNISQPVPEVMMHKNGMV